MKAKTGNRTLSDEAFAQCVTEIVDSQIRPHIQTHGGDIVIRKILGREVGVVLTGNCSGCPAAQITMEDTIERTLRLALNDEIDRVYLINEIDPDIYDFAKKLLRHNKTD